ncbi:MAG TPA: DEAD/DEAH box helicase, partial [Flavisolibacter sp.]|nr:DEAD/DEAH box helicase [Flavisolibacter sp.]
MDLKKTIGYKTITDWLSSKGHQPFLFQEETWQHIIDRNSGLVNAPTGCGKTFSVFLGALIQFINQHPEHYKTKNKNGLQLLWVTPLRALAKDIGRAMEEVVCELGLQWKIGIRNGDTDMSERQKQKRQMPEVLIITPESLHLLLAQKGYPDLFHSLKTLAVDEWHELIGSKRGVQVELAVSRIVSICRLQSPVNKQLQTANCKLSLWGISATIGNLDESKEVLLSSLKQYASSNQSSDYGVIVKAKLRKNVVIESVFPDEIEKYPWAGHLGIKLVDKVIPIINSSKTTLIFINTRGMSERWYQALLDTAPELAGAIALHHGSIEHDLRIWVEEHLHTGKLKAVVCTASLDLGVDFRPVETVIQVGSPKGVARFLQRAGRSGHSPDAISKIYFLPTHSLELVEAAALKSAIAETLIESREPMMLCFDVLTQYCCTLAISEGFKPEEIFEEVRSTYSFRDITKDDWRKILHFITEGGTALQQYDEYKKVEIEDGIFKIRSRRVAMRHRMHIGTIVSDPMLKVKFMSGGYVGVIEEWFISRLNPGDSFTLAGRNLELIGIKEMTVVVKKSTSSKSIIPSWEGGRVPLSAKLGKKLREAFTFASLFSKKQGSLGLKNKEYPGLIEIKELQPLFQLQEELSHIPKANELLIEHIETKDGFHL